MASTGVDVGNAPPPPPPPPKSDLEKGVVDDAIQPEPASEKNDDGSSIAPVSIAPGDQTHRRLKSRHIQLIGMSSVPTPAAPELTSF